MRYCEQIELPRVKEVGVIEHKGINNAVHLVRDKLNEDKSLKYHHNLVIEFLTFTLSIIFDLKFGTWIPLLKNGIIK